jgi:hypothetical protein
VSQSVGVGVGLGLGLSRSVSGASSSNISLVGSQSSHSQRASTGVFIPRYSKEQQ